MGVKATGKVRRQEVAELAGVSKTVVTYVMNGVAREKHISEATIKRVKRAAKKLNFRPSIWGRLINQQKSNLIAFITFHISDPGVSDLIVKTGEAAQKRGYNLLIYNYKPSELRRKDVVERLRDTLADAFILHGPPDSALDFWRKQSDLMEKPVCVLNQNLESGSGVSSVDLDNYQGAELALRHLLNDDVKTLGVISDSKAFRFCRERLSACEDLLATRPKVKVLYHHLTRRDNLFKSGYRAVEEWIGSGELPEAIFTMGDVLAVGAISALQHHKIEIPEQVRITGFDGSRIAEFSNPSLTTVAQPFREMAEEAINICLEKIEGKEPEAKHLKFSPKLIVRDST